MKVVIEVSSPKNTSKAGMKQHLQDVKRMVCELYAHSWTGNCHPIGIKILEDDGTAHELFDWQAPPLSRRTWITSKGVYVD